MRPKCVANIRLAAVPAAAPCSRVFVRHALEQWCLPGLYDTAALVVTELVANAVKATGSLDVSPTRDEAANICLVDVRVLGFTDRVSIHVWDNSLDPPVISNADPAGAEVGGRGLVLVGKFSQRLGHFYPRNGGKIVYADLALEKGVTRRFARGFEARRTVIDFPEADVVLLRNLLLDGRAEF